MDDNKKLKRALDALKREIDDFPVDEKAFDDLKPTEEKIRDLRQSLLSLNSRIQKLRIQTTLHSSPDPPEGKKSELISQYQAKLSNYTISNNLVNNVQQSYTVQEILDRDDIDPEIREKTKAIMHKLVSLNDTAMKLHHEYHDICLNQEIELQDKCAQMITEYAEFLREQEGIRNEKLAKSNPEVAAKKERILKWIHKINTMKRLITNFIAIAHPDLVEITELRELLKKHRDLIRLETITDLARNSEAEQED